jgi:hypothetical protein
MWLGVAFFAGLVVFAENARRHEHAEVQKVKAAIAEDCRQFAANGDARATHSVCEKYKNWKPEESH